MKNYNAGELGKRKLPTKPGRNHTKNNAHIRRNMRNARQKTKTRQRKHGRDTSRANRDKKKIEVTKATNQDPHIYTWLTAEYTNNDVANAIKKIKTTNRME